MPEKPTYEELAEALRRIIYASDRCAGHANCDHSMEPWRHARRLLARLHNDPGWNPAEAEGK